MEITQKSFLTSLCASNPDAVIIGSIGTISYDLKDIHHEKKILLKGAMGAALGVGLGYALSSKDQVIVVIGDGSFLMQMGALSTIIKHNLPNLQIIIIHNGSYASCGGQKTNFESIKYLLPGNIHVYEDIHEQINRATC